MYSLLVYIYSFIIEKQESNDIRHYLKNFDCIQNQSTKHHSIQERIAIFKAIN